jgi:hypothetical protein
MMTAATAATVRTLIANDDDFEWYPTTAEIIATVARDFLDQSESHRSQSVLDIGAGEGRVLKAIEAAIRKRDSHASVDLFAIEKSITHLSAMPKNITVVGTVFEEQTLTDKPMTAVFCNPPYSQFSEWMLKIITEASANLLYLVIPRRWRDSNEIKRAIEKRSGDAASLGEFDFENADRAARAKVEVIRVEFNYENRDAFDSVLESMMPELDIFDMPPFPDDEPQIDRDLIKTGRNIVEVFVESYNRDLMRMLSNYKSALAIDAKILAEIGVTKRKMLDSIKLKIKGMKDKYWAMLFEELGTVTQRLATKQRKAFLESLRDKVTIDFTESNVYSILIWVSKWANDYFDEQLIQLFRTLSVESCAVRYKSNDRVWTKGGWRYLRDEDENRPSHYRLEYRIVLSYGGVSTSEWTWDRNQYRGLASHAFEMLMDIVTVANNLGFACGDSPKNYQWASNVQHIFKLDNGEPLIAVRAFKNGNMHLHFNPKVMLAINVEAGRLLKWIRNPQEACEEMQVSGDDADSVVRLFGSSFRIGSDAGILKLGMEPLTHAAG